jgi:hypothetical protein
MPTSNFSTTHDSQRVFWCWVLIFLFALFRLPGFGVPLASDELAMVSLWAQMPTLKIFSNYQYPNNHIFLTVILSFLLKTFGMKEWLLRMPLLICGAVSIFLSYKLGRRVSGNIAVGLATAFLMVISEKHVFFSTNARGYLVIMMLALMAVTVVLDRLEGHLLKFKKLSNGFNVVLAFFGWVAIWILGTWTIPTFLFFEVSVAIFLMGILLSGNHVFKKASLPLLSTVVAGLVFYLQYYVLISPAMLAEATSNAAKTSLPLLFPELLAEWISPFEPAGFLFFLFALVGLSWLFRQSRITGFLMAFVWLGPILIGIAGFLLEILPGVPHARTFFYLQPFFLLLGVMGVRETGTWFLTLMKRNSGFHEKGLRIMTGVLAGILFLIASLNFLQHIYPQRLSRAPLQRVHDFVRKLNPHDLLLVSHKMHVEFYLYGARDTRNRIENIMRDRQLESIYFLDYEKKSVSGIQESDKKVKPILDFPALTGNAGKEGPTLPEEAVEVAGRFGSFTFNRLKQDWLRPLPGWEKAELDPAPLGTRPFIWDLSGIRPLIRFEDSFTVAIENKELSFYQASGLTLNLVEVAGSEKFFSAALLGGRMKEGNIIFDPSWLPNAWILDHPYGSDIFNRHWNPAVFISQGAGRLSVMDVKFSRRLGHGALRNFLSYRIDKPEVEGK